ncbi:hypothetical protein WJX73_004026 [Symbiochloris irregularis]|uniref:SREBP regulating gene protein n=1 Tax=Symbiochloris irregularis TaxID=706552 RepID=A0AAW1P6R0_9CHLO
MSTAALQEVGPFVLVLVSPLWQARRHQDAVVDSLTPPGRRLLIRRFPGDTGLADDLTRSCNNTISGRWLISDDQGWVCSRDQVLPETGCCNGGDQFSCETCSVENQCCKEYERCVSCCLAPRHNASTLYLTSFRSPDRDNTGRWSSAFEYCRGKCRTTSRSTVHENAYLDPHHHCFSNSGKPTTPTPPVPALPNTITLAVGQRGQSCQDACLEANPAGKLACAPQHFASLNDCNRLRTHFACEAGCDDVEGVAAEHPGYVVTAAPKQQRPAMCIVDLSANVSGTSTAYNYEFQDSQGPHYSR